MCGVGCVWKVGEMIRVWIGVHEDGGKGMGKWLRVRVSV